MDLTVILGMVLAVTSLTVGDLMEGGNPLGLLHITSFLIVIPTAMLNAMTGSDGHAVKAAFKEVKMVFKKSPIDFAERINEIIELAIIARRDGILALESHIAKIDDEFFKKGMSMTVDGFDIHTIEETMDIMIEETEEYYHHAAHYWILAGETCPVMGLVGAVMGLILALQKLDNPQEMAEGISGAFTATVTGIAGAYMFIGPIGNKMKAKSHAFVKEKKIILQGIIGIASGDNPRALEQKLFNYLEPGEEKKSKFE
jgi:chemotaxis protein MotA